MAAADYIPNLVEEVLAWQSNVGTQRIPNKHSEDTTEAKLGMIFAKLLLRRSKALGGKPSGRQLEPTEVALLNSLPGVPARGCSIHGEDAARPLHEARPRCPHQGATRQEEHGGAADESSRAAAPGAISQEVVDNPIPGDVVAVQTRKELQAPADNWCL